ncbi:MAG: hypothetical protein CM1200mP39_30690 [Dehalococcoidia bacterium]|nr:MAG: hypothetical protein CM1200mP39_30690 [Dehalococcoidia bacterium]
MKCQTGRKIWRYLPGVGYSGHHNGIALDIAAFTLGASFIERHLRLIEHGKVLIMPHRSNRMGCVDLGEISIR